MISLPEDFVILKFFELGFYPKYNKFNNVYQCSCPICREGKSLGKKRRCYYIPKNETTIGCFFIHSLKNCPLI